MAASQVIRASRYYFNLTDGLSVIPDEKGIELDDIDRALGLAAEAIEQLKNEDPSSTSDWLGWKFEITDQSKRLVWSIPLETSADERLLTH
jgi:hypothetical protein